MLAATHKNQLKIKWRQMMTTLPDWTLLRVVAAAAKSSENIKRKIGKLIDFGESHENWSLGREIITVRHFKNGGEIWYLAESYLGVWA